MATSDQEITGQAVEAGQEALQKPADTGAAGQEALEREDAKTVAKALTAAKKTEKSAPKKSEEINEVTAGYQKGLDIISQIESGKTYGDASHILDQIFFQIERTGVKPTSKQVGVISSILSARASRNADLRAQDHDYIQQYALSHNGQPPFTEFDREVAENQLARFREVMKTPEQKKAEKDTLIKEALGERDRRTLQEMTTRLQRAGDNIDEWVAVLGKEMDSWEAENGRNSSSYQKRIRAFWERLQFEKNTEEERANRLGRTLNPAEKAKINREIAARLRKILKEFQRGFETANQEQKEWLQEMTDKDILKVRSVHDEKNPQWKYRLEPAAGKKSELKKEAIQLATERRNAELYDITPEQRQLPPEEWKNFVSERRLMILGEMKDEIRKARKDIHGRKTVRKEGNEKIARVFGPLFIGKFSGESELKADRGEVGEKCRNMEFLKELLTDKEFMDELIFWSEDMKKDAERFNEFTAPEGIDALGELVAILKREDPAETDKIVANVVNNVYFERIDRIKKERKEHADGNGGIFVRHIDFAGIDFANADTKRFSRIPRLFERLGVQYPFDRLEGIKPENVANINAGLVLGGYDANEEDAKRYLELHKKYLGAESLQKTVEKVLFPATIEDKKEKEVVQAGLRTVEGHDAMKIAITILVGLGHLNQKNTLELEKKMRARLAAVDEDTVKYEMSELKREVEDFARVRNEIFTNERSAAEDLVQTLGIDPTSLSPEQIAKIREVLKAA